MPDVRSLSDLSWGLIMYIVVVGAVIFGFTDVKINRLWQGVFVAAMAFGFFVAFVGVLAWAKHVAGLF